MACHRTHYFNRRKIFKTFGCLLMMFIAQQTFSLFTPIDYSRHVFAKRQELDISNNDILSFYDNTSINEIGPNNGSLSFDDHTAINEVGSNLEHSTSRYNELKARLNRLKLRQRTTRTGHKSRFVSNSTLSKSHISSEKDLLSATNADIIDFFHISDVSEKDILINLHHYTFSIQSNLCSLKSPDIVIFVHSATFNKDRRKAIRKSWGKYGSLEDITLSTVFMIGQTGSGTLQRELETESEQHGDLVQGNFLDSYRNMTFKHMMALHWVLTNCHSAKLFVKVDDDVLVNVFNLVRYVCENGFRSDFLYCNMFHSPSTMRGQIDKWYVSVDEYPFTNYPTYCQGMAYLMSPDVARLLYNASESTRSYWVDDVYVTGLLTLKVGQNLTHTKIGHRAAPMKGYLRGRVNNFMFLLGTRFYNVLWRSLLDNTPAHLKNS